MLALILVNGELYRPEVLRRRIAAEKFDLIVGADAGARHALSLGVTPDAVIGDMDSLPDTVKQEFPKAELVTYPPEKNETDLELALRYAVNKGADRIVLVGFMGGRMDMTIANVLLLAGTDTGAARIELWHGDETGWLIRPPGDRITGYAGDTISFIPLAGDASGVKTTGMKYPLNNEKLTFGPARGVSNELIAPLARITLKEGLLFAVHIPRPVTAKENNAMPEKRMRNVSVQCLPLVPDAFPIVDKAIEVIKNSGLKYEVGPLETTMEGDDLDKLIEVAKAAHRACFTAGAGRVVTIIKIADALEGTTMEQKVAKHRPVKK